MVLWWAEMEVGKIVPDIIDAAPTQLIEITYDTGVKIELGKEVTPKQVDHLPIITWKADPNDLHTLLMTDADGLPHHNGDCKEVHHLLIINIHDTNPLNGQLLIDYITPEPEKDSGLHRYVFLLFPQKKFIESTMFIPRGSSQGRRKASTRKLMEEFQLENPIAGNYFLTKYEELIESSELPPSTS